MTPTDLEALRERVRVATEADGVLDIDIAEAFSDGEPIHFGWEAHHYTGSVDAVTALIERLLPGWAWKIGTCSVSDDAWLVPDFNSPEHGARLRQEFGYPERVPAGSIWDNGIDIDRRPAGNVPLALLDALLSALIAQQVEG